MNLVMTEILLVFHMRFDVKFELSQDNSYESGSMNRSLGIYLSLITIKWPNYVYVNIYEKCVPKNQTKKHHEWIWKKRTNTGE